MILRIKSYSELVTIEGFLERFNYLRLKGVVGESTFGFERYLNQRLYTSRRWRSTREKVMIRDEACDLGVEGYELYGDITIHHINPITIDDVRYDRDVIYDLENLITTHTNRTHKAIHFGDESLLPQLPIQRRPGDTTPWR